MKRFLILLVFFAQGVLAQTVLETNPTGLRWMQINSPNFRVIFPEGFDDQAQRMTSTLEKIRTAESKSMGVPPRRISIILQNQSSISNGFVSMFPRRSEFYTMPTQNYNFIGSNDWLNLLVSHEYRHIVQYQHAMRGFNRAIFYLFGGPSLAGMAHAAAPDWFWEGDAVATETAFTPSGRGRIPNFNLLFKTNLVEGREFNYHKQYLQSYKHQIPDHYVFGFNVISWLRREKNDGEIWERITRRAWNVPFIPFRFSSSVRRETGMGVSRLYRSMANDLSREWKSEIDSLSITPFTTINNRRTEAYTDYLFPQPQSDGSVIAMKEGIGDIETFVRLTSDGEQVIFTPGFMNDAGALSSARNLIVWNEFGFDPRWPVRTYSLIKAYDIANKSRLVVSDKDARLGSAALSPDGKRIATVRSDVNYKHTLLVIDYSSGRILNEFPNPDNEFFSMPRWSEDGNNLVVIRQNNEGKTFSIINVSTGSSRDVLPFSHENTGHPVFAGEWLLFNSSVSGIDNIYAIHLSTGERKQVTNARYGAYNPAPDAGKQFIYYNNQGRNGMDIVRIPFAPDQWKAFVATAPAVNPHEHLVLQEGEPDLFKDIPKGNYDVTRFRKFAHVINPFSWGLLLENDLSRIDVGVASRDLLSTTSLSAGYTYDLAEQNGLWRVGLSYQGLYPIIDLSLTQGERSVDEELTTIIVDNSNTTSVTNTFEVTWQEQNILAGVRVPLNLTRSKYSSGVDLGYGVGVTKINNFNNGLNDTRFIPARIVNNEVKSRYFLIDYLGGGTFAYHRASLRAYRFMKRSRRDIQSKWGQSLDIEYMATPFGGSFEGGVFSATGYLFFPGLVRHHSFYTYGAYQKTMIPDVPGENDYLFRNTIPLPRGINDYVVRHREMVTGSANYTLPLWYPDIALGPVLNIQRIRLNVFADAAMGRSAIFNAASNSTYVSAGGELMFDINLMRFRPQFDIGIRYTYGIDPAAVTNVELVLGNFRF